MNHLSFVLCLLAFAVQAQLPLNFTVTSASGNFSLSCKNPSVSLTASSNHTSSAVSYSWTDGTSILTGSNVTLNNTGTYTVVAFASPNYIGIQTITINPPGNYATGSIISPQNFTLGCGSKSVVTVSGVSMTTVPPGAPVHFTIIPPGGGSPQPPFPPVPSFSFTVAGTYTAVFVDAISLCEARLPFSIVNNAFQPGISVFVPTTIVTCNNPSVVLTATSSTGNVNFEWKTPYAPGLLSGSSCTVSPTSVPTSSLAGTFTAVATDKNNACSSSSVITIWQNTYPPIAQISNGGITALSCKVATIMLINQSTSSIPNPTIFTQPPVIGLLWEGPTPSPVVGPSTTYTAAIPGVYTLTAKDLYNGCTRTATIAIGDDRTFPILNNPNPAPVYCLVGPTASIAPVISSPTAGLTYTWSAPPSASVSGVNSAILTTNAVGIYTILVTNVFSGCISTATVELAICNSIAENFGRHPLVIFPNPSQGVVGINIPEDGSLEIVDVCGKVVFEGEQMAGAVTIDLSRLSPGSYSVRFCSGSTVAWTRLVLE